MQKYLNAKKVPQLFAATGASKFTDPKNFPWTMGFNPNYFVEGRARGNRRPAVVDIAHRRSSVGGAAGVKPGRSGRAAAASSAVG